MPRLIVFHEVQDGGTWARAWGQGPGSRHEMFGKIGVTARTFRDPENLDSTGLVLDVPDLAEFRSLLESAEGKKAMEEDGLKVETMRILEEFTP